jgi:hypothetical protein
VVGKQKSCSKQAEGGTPTSMIYETWRKKENNRIVSENQKLYERIENVRSGLAKEEVMAQRDGKDLIPKHKGSVVRKV